MLFYPNSFNISLLLSIKTTHQGFNYESCLSLMHSPGGFTTKNVLFVSK